jgi:hypothetical protein
MTALEILTITLIVVGSFFVWRCRPLTAICVYFAIIVLYPQHWTFKFGGMPTLFVGKVLIFPLMLNLVFKAKRLSGFRPNVLDAGVVLLLLGQLTAGLIQGEDLWQVIAEQSHYIATETLGYFAVRLSITSRRDLLFLVKVLLALRAERGDAGPYGNAKVRILSSSSIFWCAYWFRVVFCSLCASGALPSERPFLEMVANGNCHHSCVSWPALNRVGRTVAFFCCFGHGPCVLSTKEIFAGRYSVGSRNRGPLAAFRTSMGRRCADRPPP